MTLGGHAQPQLLDCRPVKTDFSLLEAFKREYFTMRKVAHVQLDTQIQSLFSLKS